jgi:hypothetical protein
MWMKNSSDIIGDRSCDLPVCNAVPQPLHHRVPPNLVRRTLNLYVTNRSLHRHLSIHKNQINHPEDGGSTFCRNVETYQAHYVVWNPRNRIITWTFSNSLSYPQEVCLFLKSYLQPYQNLKSGTRQRSRYSDTLRAGRSGDRIPVWGKIFRTCPDRPWIAPDHLYDGYRVFLGGKAAEALLWPPIRI